MIAPSIPSETGSLFPSYFTLILMGILEITMISFFIYGIFKTILKIPV